MPGTRGLHSDGNLLVEAAHLGDLDTIRKLVKGGAVHEKAFLLDEEAFLVDHMHDFPYTTGKLIGIWEALLFSGHPLPNGDNKKKLFDRLSGLPKKHWELTLPLLKRIFKDPGFFVESDLDRKPEREYSLPIIVAHQLLCAGNLEAIKALVPLSMTEKEIQRWYSKTNNVNMQSFPYQIFNDLNQEKLAILDYLLQVFPEQTWQKIGTIEGGLKAWLPLVSKAADNGDITLVKWLMERGCSLNDPGLLEYDSGISINPITRAVQAGNSSIILELLKLGCSVDTIPTEKLSPLLAVIEQHYQVKNLTETVQEIVHNGANIEFQGTYRCTALCAAASRNLHETVKLLINNGANIEASDENGYTPLELACIYNSFESFTHLYRAGSSYRFTKYNLIKMASAPIKSWVENEILQKQTQPARSKHKFTRL